MIKRSNGNGMDIFQYIRGFMCGKFKYELDETLTFGLSGCLNQE